jgi:hypothetical protein
LCRSGSDIRRVPASNGEDAGGATLGCSVLLHADLSGPQQPNIFQFAIVEVVVTSIQDGFPAWIKKNLMCHEVLVLIICVVSLICGLPNVTQVQQLLTFARTISTEFFRGESTSSS